jgi:hypothetical protein
VRFLRGVCVRMKVRCGQRPKIKCSVSKRGLRSSTIEAAGLSNQSGYAWKVVVRCGMQQLAQNPIAGRELSLSLRPPTPIGCNKNTFLSRYSQTQPPPDIRLPLSPSSSTLFNIVSPSCWKAPSQSTPKSLSQSTTRPRHSQQPGYSIRRDWYQYVRR